MSSRQPPRRHRAGRGSRRELQILLPVALVTLVALSTFTLFSYRSSLALLAEERREEAAQAAGQLAVHLAVASAASAAELVRLAPGASGVAVADPAGSPLLAAGDLPSADLLAPAGGVPFDLPAGFGPGGQEPFAVTGLAPVPAEGSPRYVRVDLPAAVLASQLRGLRVLSVVVLAVNSALVLLVLFSLSALLAPFDRVLARARQMEELGGPGGGAAPDDDVELLLAAFDRAQAALDAPPPRGEEDVAALERSLAASLQSGVLLLDREGAMLTVNPLGATLLGLDRSAGAGAAVPGVPLEDLLAAHPELARRLRGAVDGRLGVQRQEWTVEAGGARRTLGFTVHPLRRGDGAPRGYLVLFADLTEARREAEASRLAESLARVGETAAGVAHELRNGLATIRGYLTLIGRRPDEESVADFLSEIGRESDHLERVLDDFLAFARPGTARVEELALAALLKRAAADPALAGVEVALRLPEGEAGAVTRLRGDPQLLERALRNLLRNAAEAERAAGRSGPVEVSSARTSAGVEIAVEDRGAGVPAELRERLFRPFATGRPGGVGLGLALAQRILVLHGGQVLLEDRPGGGTRALVLLPADILVTAGNETPAVPGAAGAAAAAL